MKENNKIGIWLVLGTGMGIAIGTALDQLTLGVAFGPAFGMLIGIIASNKNTDDDNPKKE